jgi:hypothetical protein
MVMMSGWIAADALDQDVQGTGKVVPLPQQPSVELDRVAS